MGLADIAGPDCRRQTIDRLVRRREYLLQVSKWHGADNRPKDFLLRDLHLLRGVDQHGRFDKVASVAQLMPADHCLGAFGETRLQVAEYAPLLLVRHQRAHLRGEIHTRPHLDLLCILSHACHYLVEDTLLNKEPRACAAALALVEKYRA